MITNAGSLSVSPNGTFFNGDGTGRNGTLVNRSVITCYGIVTNYDGSGIENNGSFDLYPWMDDDGGIAGGTMTGSGGYAGNDSVVTSAVVVSYSVDGTVNHRQYFPAGNTASSERYQPARSG